MSLRRIRPVVPALALILALALNSAGCGSDEHHFTSEEFIEAINAEGAGVALGPATATTEDGIEIHEVTFTETSTGVGSPAIDTPAGEHGSGSLLIVGDADAARAEFEDCDSVEELTCFRAANAVLRFEDMDGADQARIVTSLEAIQTGEG